MEGVLKILEKCLVALLPINIARSSILLTEHYASTMKLLMKAFDMIEDGPIKTTTHTIIELFIREMYIFSSRFLTDKELLQVQAINITHSIAYMVPPGQMELSIYDAGILSQYTYARYGDDTETFLRTMLSEKKNPHPPEMIERVRSELERSLAGSSVAGRLNLFGSSRNGTCGAGSDIDMILVTSEFESLVQSKFRKPYYDNLRSLGHELQLIQEKYYQTYFFRLVLSKVVQAASIVSDEIATILQSYDIDYKRLESMLFSQIISKLYQLRNQHYLIKDHLEDIRSSKQVKNSIYALTAVFKRHGCIIEDTRRNARVPVCKIIEPVIGNPCDIVMNFKLGIYNSDLIWTFSYIDPTGKVHDYLMLIKRFVKCRNICDASKGYPSSYAWMVIALHVLLRHGFLPVTMLLYQGVYFCEGFDVSFDHEGYSRGYRQEIPYKCSQLLASFSLSQLFHLFCEYCLNIDTNHVLTLRLFGSVLTPDDVTTLTPPSEFNHTSTIAADDNNDDEDDDESIECEVSAIIENPLPNGFPYGKKKAWRIEDPFENIHSVTPHNLGRTMWANKYEDVQEIMKYCVDVMYELRSIDRSQTVSSNESDISAFTKFNNIFNPEISIIADKKKRRKRKPRKPKAQATQTLEPAVMPPKVTEPVMPATVPSKDTHNKLPQQRRPDERNMPLNAGAANANDNATVKTVPVEDNAQRRIPGYVPKAATEGKSKHSPRKKATAKTVA